MTFHDPHSDSKRPDVPPSGRAPAPWDPEDPRWSAYLLGEMSPAERLAVEAILEENPDARRDFEELADAADLVRLAFEAVPLSTTPLLHAEETHRSSSSTVAPSKRRFRSGGPLAFLAVAASLGLCLMLVVQNPARRGSSDSPLAAPIGMPVMTYDAPGTPFAKGFGEPTATLATVVNSVTGREDSAHTFRLTPSLALSYFTDSFTPEDSLAVSVRNGEALDGAWYDAAAANRSPSPGDHSRSPASGGGAPGSRMALDRADNPVSGKSGRGGEASDYSLGLTPTESPLQQMAAPVESKPAGVAAPELREVLLVSRFQTPATVPVAAIPVQVGRQSMAEVEQSLARGSWPAPESIRLEEMVNAFEYDDPLPPGDDVAELRVEAGACPWNERHRLVRIGLRAEPVDLARRPTFRAVFVVDSRRPEMLTQFNESLAEASRHFSPLDRVTVFDASGTISVPTVAGDQLERQLRGLQTTAAPVWNRPAAPGVASEPATPSPPAAVTPMQSVVVPPVAGTVPAAPRQDAWLIAKGETQPPRVSLDNAFDVARKTFVAGANNSVVLLTDEPLAEGETDTRQLREKVQSGASFGVNLSAVDVNANYGNPVLYQLVDLGNGTVNTVSTVDELSEAVVQELAGGNSVIATEVQLQVEFNPVRIEAYRLLGYEHWNGGSIDPRLLAAQKELRAGDRLCAVIEVRLNPETSATLASLPLRYRQSNDFFVDVDIRDGEPPAPPVDHEKEWLTARLIYTPSGSSLQATREVPFDGDSGSTSPAIDWAACVVDFGERLKQPERLTTASLQGIRRRAQQTAGPDPLGTRQKFLNVLDQAIDLTGRTPQQPAQPAALSSSEARTKATCGGRYRDLLDKIAVPADYTRYGAFHDLGFRPPQSYQGHADLPAGHWVYVYPHWYIWGSSDEQIYMAAPPPPVRAAPAPAPPAP